MTHEYHVAYLFKNGRGSMHVTTKFSALTRDGIAQVKAYIEGENKELGSVVIANIIPFKKRWQFWK